MTENNSQISEPATEVTQGMFEKVKTFATSKKGLYLIGAILLIGKVRFLRIRCQPLTTTYHG